MLSRNAKFMMCAAAAAAALAVILPSSAGAQSLESCSAYARDIAASEAPRRGLIDGVVVGTLDTVLTGGQGYEERYRRAYDRAYADCIDRDVIAYAAPAERGLVVVEPPAAGTAEWYRYCAAKYRSFDPDTGMFLSYSGDYLPCR